MHFQSWIGNLIDHLSFASFKEDELQHSYVLRNNDLIFTLLGFLYLLGGSIV